MSYIFNVHITKWVPLAYIAPVQDSGLSLSMNSPYDIPAALIQYVIITPPHACNDNIGLYLKANTAELFLVILLIMKFICNTIHVHLVQCKNATVH